MADSARELLREVRISITHTCRPPAVNPKKKISKTGPKVRQPQQPCCPRLFAVALGLAHSMAMNAVDGGQECQKLLRMWLPI